MLSSEVPYQLWTLVMCQTTMECLWITVSSGLSWSLCLCHSTVFPISNHTLMRLFMWFTEGRTMIMYIPRSSRIQSAHKYWLLRKEKGKLSHSSSYPWRTHMQWLLKPIHIYFSAFLKMRMSELQFLPTNEMQYIY